MYLADVPCHIVSRGNNRDACFFTLQDYSFYLECLGDAARRYRVAIHAYVLMTNHVHLLMTPKSAEGISRLMQSLGRRYVQYVNHEYQRCGTLWESRHKASLIDAERYLLACYRYIELNPVRARMVRHPSEYRWSSFHANSLGEPDTLVSPHSLYRALGTTEESRRFAYRDLCESQLDPGAIRDIRTATRFSMPVGDHRFKAQVEAALGRSIGQCKLGRPKRHVHGAVPAEN
jgi:putative transposase